MPNAVDSFPDRHSLCRKVFITVVVLESASNSYSVSQVYLYSFHFLSELTVKPIQDVTRSAQTTSQSESLLMLRLLPLPPAAARAELADQTPATPASESA